MLAGQERFGVQNWPAPVFSLFLSEATPEQVTAAGRAAGWQAGCEWPYCVGEYWLRLGRRQEARAALEEGLREDCRPVIEFREAGRAIRNPDRKSALGF